MPSDEAAPTIYQLKITLLEIVRPVWRRVQVSNSIPLNDLHRVFQIVMGWTDSHLHQFEKGRVYWGVPEHDGFDDDVVNEKRVPLSDVLKAAGDSMIYLYDFGDNWRHQVILEKILPANDVGGTNPICTGGERRCPPEDVGGPLGYRDFLEVIFQPNHEGFADLRSWAGGTFHAEEFDLSEVNKGLARIRRTQKRGKSAATLNSPS